MMTRGLYQLGKTQLSRAVGRHCKLYQYDLFDVQMFNHYSDYLHVNVHTVIHRMPFKAFAHLLPLPLFPYLRADLVQPNPQHLHRHVS